MKYFFAVPLVLMCLFLFGASIMLMVKGIWQYGGIIMLYAVVFLAITIMLFKEST